MSTGPDDAGQAADQAAQPPAPEQGSTDTTEASATEEAADESHVMELLQEKVPLSLIIDLSAPAGPDSEQILDEEGEPEDAWWEPLPE
ncbi:hypothetical protein [Thalassiella azotivora]